MDIGMNHTLDSLPRLWPLVRHHLHQLCGLVLGENQAYLLTRLEPVARDSGHPSVAAFLQASLTGSRPDLDRLLIEAMTTHETSFFRDAAFWDTFRQRTMPSLAALGRPIQIWSAACSTGQEPYSLAMMLADHFPHVSYELWATDIAEETLARASRGYFSRHEVDRGLSAAQVQSHFEPDGAGLRAKPYLRRSMRFDIYNLLGKAHPLRTFDLALCRNVLVYFDEASRERAMTRLEASLTPTGWLGLGSTELPVKATPDLVRVPDGGGWLNRASPKGR